MNKEITTWASLTAWHALLVTSPSVAAEDLMTDAIDMGRDFADRLQASARPVKENDAEVFDPQEGDFFYYPQRNRGGFFVQSDTWNNSASQQSLHQLHLCFHDYERCLEYCLAANKGYGIV